MNSKIAMAWLLLVIIGLLVGLVILATALGVVRHTRRNRGRNDVRPPGKRDAEESAGRARLDEDGEE